jgi:hypothetical protein
VVGSNSMTLISLSESMSIEGSSAAVFTGDGTLVSNLLYNCDLEALVCMCVCVREREKAEKKQSEIERENTK